MFYCLSIAAKSQGQANALGIKTDKNLAIAKVSASQTSMEDDGTIRQTLQEALDKINARAREKGIANRYKYLNYAAPTQDPISRYSTGKRTRPCCGKPVRKCDPRSLFQKGYDVQVASSCFFFPANTCDCSLIQCMMVLTHFGVGYSPRDASSPKC